MKILNKIFIAIFSVIFGIELMGSIIVVIILMSIWNDKNRRFRQIWARLQRRCLFYEIQTIGEPNLDANMMIMNHQSMLDIIVLEDIHPKNLCWIAKKEILDMPIFGKILSVPKMIPIDRNNPRAMPKIIAEVKDRIEQNRPIMIFPEGTRSDGQDLLEFHSGAKIIAQKLNLKVQPIVIVGSKKILDTKKFIARPGGKLKIIFLDLVDTTSDDWFEQTRTLMQTTLKQHLD